MKNFEQLGVDKKIITALSGKGFSEPMPIQTEVIPRLLESRPGDMIALAQTGTGKTAAFGIPLIQTTDTSNLKTQYLILSPTRELCMQITNDLSEYATHYSKVKITSVFGGADIDRQIKKIKKGVHIISATPGRLLDLINRGIIDLSNIKTVVLDEADEMLNMGFRPDLEAILSSIPEQKNMLLFSATMSQEVRTIASRFMQRPEEIAVGKPNEGAANIEHFAYAVSNRDKDTVLKRVIDAAGDIYGIIFCKTRKETVRIAELLTGAGYKADALNGELSQTQRDIVMKKFRTKQINLLIATDVAARGLDVDDLTHIINYTLPDDSEVYIHRSGRTGRVGKYGISLVLANHKEIKQLSHVEKLLKKKFSFAEIPTIESISAIRINDLIDRFLGADISTQELKSLLPAVQKKLAHLDREELIERFVAMAFRKFMSPADQLSEDVVIPRTRKAIPVNIPRKNYTRFFINLGKSHQLKPASLIGMINDFTDIREINVGEIEILNNFSFFETDHTYSSHILEAFKDKKLKKRPIVVEHAAAKTADKKSRVRRLKRRMKNSAADFRIYG